MKQLYDNDDDDYNNDDDDDDNDDDNDDNDLFVIFQFGVFEGVVSGICDELPQLQLPGRKTLLTGFLAFIQLLLGIPLVTRVNLYSFVHFNYA